MSESESADTEQLTNRDNITAVEESEPKNGSSTEGSTALDPRLIKKVEIAAQDIGKELDQLMSSIANSVQSVCAFSTGYMDNFRQSTDQLSGSVSSSVGEMYSFIQKVRILNEELDGVDAIHEEIKEIKKTLDVLEALAARLIPTAQF